MSLGERIRDRRMELGMSQSDLAHALQVSRAAIGHYETGENHPPAKVMVRLFDCLQIEPNTLYKDSFHQGNGVMSHKERQLVDKYRELSRGNKEAVRGMVDALWSTQQETASVPAVVREIPLYISPAAAGYVAPVFGEDFEYIPVKDLVPTAAEFAVRIQGDSMEPHIADGAVVYVNRDPLSEGDVGIFCVDGSIFCKQYYRDGAGTVYLFSLNRDRADADVVLTPGSQRMFACFGRVMMKALPLPGR